MCNTLNTSNTPKNFDEYRSLVLPAFEWTREKIATGESSFICPELERYAIIESNEWLRNELRRIMRSVLGDHGTLTSWACKHLSGTYRDYESDTPGGIKLRLDTIDMIVETIKTW